VFARQAAIATRSPNEENATLPGALLGLKIVTRTSSPLGDLGIAPRGVLQARLPASRPRRNFAQVRDLFEEKEDVEAADSAAPLATRMRPRSLEELVGQEHILGRGKLLRRAIEADRLPSVIFSGPPGSGKTTLARVIAETTHAKFIRISGVESNVAEMRRVIAAATNRLRTSGQKTILFIDEIHHFNKAQQDILLPDVEAGSLRLIGATTYNPFFYVNSALVSRSQVFRLEPLSVQQLEQLIDRALADKERGLGNYSVKIDKDARRHLAKLSDGDARKCLNALEIGVLTTTPDSVAGGDPGGPQGKKTPHSVKAGVNAPGYSPGEIHFTLTVAEESIQQKAVVYDRAGDAHYDTISAFIKSMRASDEKGAMYWLAKMLHAGEDFRFIARRIVIFASEDIGLADPQALPLAIATQQAVEFVGMPEARIPLAHATAYMCRAPKSREAYDALNAATEKIETEHTKGVPEDLKNIHFPVNPER
jgi:putative ATPase